MHIKVYSERETAMIENKSIGSRIRIVVIYLIVILLGFMCLFPLWNIVCISFSGNAAVMGNRVRMVPIGFNTEAYKKIMDDAQFWRSFVISTVRVVISLVLNMVLIVLTAYPLTKTKYEFKGRNIYMYILIFAMLFSGGMIPVYMVVKNLGLLNTIWALILPGAVPVFSVIMVMNFFNGIPKALGEAATIDGANPLQILTKVYIPCSKPVLATVALFSIVGNWNDFMSGMIYNTKVKNYPLMTYIQSLTVNIESLVKGGATGDTLANAMKLSNKSLDAAKIIVAVVPLLLIYPLLQKYLITGIVMGSVKE